MAQGNLPNTVSEDSLGKLFAKAGPVGTVKIMWRKHTVLQRALILQLETTIIIDHGQA